MVFQLLASCLVLSNPPVSVHLALSCRHHDCLSWLSQHMQKPDANADAVAASASGVAVGQAAQVIARNGTLSHFRSYTPAPPPRPGFYLLWFVLTDWLNLLRSVLLTGGGHLWWPAGALLPLLVSRMSCSSQLQQVC